MKKVLLGSFIFFCAMTLPSISHAQVLGVLMFSNSLHLLSVYVYSIHSALSRSGSYDRSACGTLHANAIPILCIISKRMGARHLYPRRSSVLDVCRNGMFPPTCNGCHESVHRHFSVEIFRPGVRERARPREEGLRRGLSLGCRLAGASLPQGSSARISAYGRNRHAPVQKIALLCKSDLHKNLWKSLFVRCREW